MWIDIEKDIKAEYLRILYWYSVCEEHFDCSYEDFIPTQSLVYRFNHYMKEIRNAEHECPEQFAKAVDWDYQRKKTKNFQKKLQIGHQFEVWVIHEFQNYGMDLGFFYDDKGQFAGENKFGIEIKNDTKYAETGNLYIEYQERLRPEQDWHDAGILKQDNSGYWLIGDREHCFIFEKRTLVSIYETLKRGEKVRGCFWRNETEHHTSKGFLLNPAKNTDAVFAKSIGAFIQKLKQNNE